MYIKVWSNFQKKTNSTARPSTAGTEIQGYLRNSDPFSMLSPKINFELQDKTQPPLWTYLYIPEFNRYYWIVDWIHNEGVWTALTQIDLLATYKEEIGNKDMYVLRASNMFDPYIEDTKYPMTSRLLEYKDNVPSVWVQQPGTQEAIIVPNLWNRTLWDGCFVLSIYGPNNSGITNYLMSPQSFFDFANRLYTYDITSDGLWAQIPEGFAKAVADPIQFVSSVKWYPILPYELSGYNADITLGYYRIGNLNNVRIISNVKPISYFMCNLSIRKHPQESRGHYLNTPPYSNYKLFLPPFGEFDIDASRLISCSSIRAEWYVDYQTGAARLFLYGIQNNPSYEFFLGSVDATYGVEIPLNQNTINLSKAVTNASLLYGVAGAIKGMNDTLATPQQDVITKHYDIIKPVNDIPGFSVDVEVPNLDVGTTLKDIASAAIGGFKSFSPGLAPKLHSVGGISSFLTFMSGVPGSLTTTFYYIAEEDPNNIGKPLCMIKKPQDLGGYMIVENPKITTIGTLAEAAMIKNILTGGFFYE